MLFPSIRSPSDRKAPGLALVLAAILTAGPLLAGGSARAADGGEAARARIHYKQGEEAFKEGRFDEAIKEWQLGYQLSARPLFLLNMAHAERRRGELRNARALYKRFLLMEPQTRLRREIEMVLQEIDSTLAIEPAGTDLEPRALGGEGAAEPAASAPTDPTQPGTPPAPAPIAPPALVPPPLLDPVPLARPAPPPVLIERVADRPPPDRPIYRRWWFWAGTGAVVASGVAAALLLRRQPFVRTGSIGTVGTAP